MRRILAFLLLVEITSGILQGSSGVYPLVTRRLKARWTLVCAAALVGAGYLLFLPFHGSLAEALVSMAIAGVGSGAFVAARAWPLARRWSWCRSWRSPTPHPSPSPSQAARTSRAAECWDGAAAGGAGSFTGTDWALSS